MKITKKRLCQLAAKRATVYLRPDGVITDFDFACVIDTKFPGKANRVINCELLPDGTVKVPFGFMSSIMVLT